MPSGWRWLGLSRLPLRGQELSYFVVRDQSKFRVFANAQLEVVGELEVFEADVTDQIERLDPDVVVLALRRGDERLVCIGSTLDVAYTFPVSLGKLIEGERNYRVQLYNQGMGRWTDGETALGAELKNMALRIEAQSYSLARLMPAE